MSDEQLNDIVLEESTVIAKQLFSTIEIKSEMSADRIWADACDPDSKVDTADVERRRSLRRKMFQMVQAKLNEMFLDKNDKDEF